jgi:hypothetical protein
MRKGDLCTVKCEQDGTDRENKKEWRNGATRILQF